MHRIFFQDVLWLTPAVLQLGIALVMVYRRLSQEYPAFWASLVLDVFRTALLFSIGNDRAHYALYFRVFWETEIVACLLGFLVIIEIFRKTFSKRLGLEEKGTTLLQISLVLLILIALWMVVKSPTMDPNMLVDRIMILNRVEILVQTGLIAALIVFVSILGVPWTNYTVGIAAGLALDGAAEVVMWAVRARYGRLANGVVMWGGQVATFCQVLVWAMYFFRRKADSARVSDSNVVCMAVEINRLNEAVESFLERQC